MRWVWTVFWLWAVLVGAARAGVVDLPLDGRPQSLQADDFDRFYVDYGTKLIRWTNAEDRVFEYPPPEGWRSQGIRHEVIAANGEIRSLQKVGKKECHDKECTNYTNYYKYVLWRCLQNGQCKSDAIASWSVGKDEKHPDTWFAEFRTTEKGTLLLHKAKTKRTSDGSKTTHHWRCGREECDRDQYTEQWFAEMTVPPTYRIHEKKKTFYGGALGPAPTKITLAAGLLDAMAAVDTSFVYDRKGRPHIYKHNVNRKLVHEFVDESGAAPEKAKTVIDGPESGASQAAVRVGDGGVLVFHYFYRNSYYKGVKATYFPDAMAPRVWQVDVDNSRDGNPGWQLLAAATSQGRVMVSYLKDPIGKKSTRIRLFDNIESIEAAKAEEPTGWERNYKIWFGRVGAGPGLAFWNFASGGPSDDDFTGVDPSFRMDTSYSAPPSIMIGGTVEARFGGFSLGASYARNQIQAAATELTETTGNPVYERLFGQIGIDKIIKYHDVRIALRIGKLDLAYGITPRGEDLESRRTATGLRSSLYRRVDIFLLNTWRVRYGLFNQSYEAVMPFYVWGIDAGATSYHFVDSFQTGATFNDYGITVGYSRLDYATKFENKVTAPFFDMDAGFGISTAKFDTTITLADGSTESSAWAIMIPYNLEAGGVILRRSHRLRGLGWYGRVFYRAEGSWAGTSGKPGDKDEAAEEAATTIGYDRFALRHGPYLDVGLVF